MGVLKDVMLDHVDVVVVVVESDDGESCRGDVCGGDGDNCSVLV